MKLKYLLIIIVLLSSMLLLNGCFDANSVETLAYAVALGFDKAQDNNIKITLQFAVPSASDTSSGSSQASSSTIVDVTCSTLDEGISLINSHISKKINLSHCKVIVFSEELAYEGISDYILNLMNNVQVRPDCNLIISRCDASYFLSNSMPTLESVPARYYELIFNSSKYTGYTQSIYLTDFYERMINNRCEPIAILGGVNTISSESNSDNINSGALKNGYKADETPLETQNHVENMGLAVFSKDYMVGELNSLETLCHMIVSNKLKTATITVPHPNDLKKNISVNIYLEKHTKNNVQLINDYPYITSDVWITGYVLNIDESLDLTNKETLNIINDSVLTYLDYSISSYLYKTAKEYHTDIDNFGSEIVKNYLTDKDWDEIDWLDNYRNAFFNINVHCNISSSSLFNKF